MSGTAGQPSMALPAYAGKIGMSLAKQDCLGPVPFYRASCDEYAASTKASMDKPTYIASSTLPSCFILHCDFAHGVSFRNKHMDGADHTSQGSHVSDVSDNLLAATDIFLLHDTTPVTSVNQLLASNVASANCLSHNALMQALNSGPQGTGAACCCVPGAVALPPSEQRPLCHQPLP